MLCIYINNVFVFIHTAYCDIIDVLRGSADEMVKGFFSKISLIFKKLISIENAFVSKV